MPHSTQGSAQSNDTFDLTSDPRPASSPSERTSQNYVKVHSRGPPKEFGVAVTSSSSRDERADLPSQRDSATVVKRRSRPNTAGTPGGDWTGMNGSNRSSNLDDHLMQQRPGDRTSARSHSYNDLLTQRTQYFDDPSQYRDKMGAGVRERAQRQSPVIAELKTNVIIKDEFTLVTDLSYHLAKRYARPESCIMVRIDHSACLAFGGTFDPSYMLNINTVPSQMSPAMNKRNAVLIQQFIADILSVPSDRGIVTFVPIPEENLAVSGMTFLGEVEKPEKTDPGAMKSAIKDTSRKGTTPSKKSQGKMLRGNESSDNLATASSASEDERVRSPPQELSSSGDTKADSLLTAPSSVSTDHPPNGLRMNGVSTDAEAAGKSSRTVNNRPSSLGAGPMFSVPGQITNQQLQPIQPLSKQGPQSPQITNRSEPQRPKHIPLQVKQVPDPVPLAPRSTPYHPQVQDRTSSLTTSGPQGFSNPELPRAPEAESRQRNTYLDNVSTLTGNPEQRATYEALTSNSTKRRSTITATPKLPLAPPSPVENPGKTKSISSRLSKRKSFIKIFKRETVPPWYKQ